jgi:hypothetical protein
LELQASDQYRAHFLQWCFLPLSFSSLSVHLAQRIASNITHVRWNVLQPHCLKYVRLTSHLQHNTRPALTAAAVPPPPRSPPPALGVAPLTSLGLHDIVAQLERPGSALLISFWDTLAYWPHFIQLMTERVQASLYMIHCTLYERPGSALISFFWDK